MVIHNRIVRTSLSVYNSMWGHNNEECEIHDYFCAHREIRSKVGYSIKRRLWIGYSYYPITDYLIKSL
jgi:hypothetical protein